MRSDLHEANRLSWNAATRAHNSHKADQAAFFRNGGSTLYPEELQLLGHLDGLRLLHLQCNAGQDSLSLARLRPRHRGRHRRQRHRLRPPAVPRQRHRRRLPARRHPPLAARRRHPWRTLRTGLRLLRHAGLALRPQALGRRHRPGTGSRRALRPGGVPSFRPVLRPTLATGLRLLQPRADRRERRQRLRRRVRRQPGALRLPRRRRELQQPSSQLRVPVGPGRCDRRPARRRPATRTLEEYPYANGWAGFDGMRDGGGGRMLPPADRPRLPLMYGLSARKPR